MILSGTGSRSLRMEPASIRHEIFTRTFKAVSLLHPDHIISGMAEGFDDCLATVAIGLGIPFTAALPTANYGTYYWRDHSVTKTDQYERFQWLLSQAANTVVVSKTLYRNGRHANFLRNDFMVDKADHMLVYKPTSRGTADAFRTINRTRIPYTLIEEV